MPNGFNGKILKIDLSTQSILVEEPEDIFYRTYMGGSSLALYYLLKELGPGIDPLGPDNVIVFASSIISGFPIPGTPRYTIAAKSPLTGGFGESEAGGFWGPELKKAGYDAIVIKGKAKKPVYLFIKDGEVTIEDASSLWGKGAKTTQNKIRQKHNDKFIHVALIGQAGENLVRYACVMNNLRHANGRSGMGAVMGSKNLKAIAVRGNNRLPVENAEGIKELAASLNKDVRNSPFEKAMQDHGTPTLVGSLNPLGLLPTNNFNRSSFENAEKLSAEELSKDLLIGNEGCFACSIRCKRKVGGGKHNVSDEYGGPEYETIAAFGSCLGIDDLDLVAKANEMCNRYTLDTISTGVTIAFAMECFENGLLSTKDTGGLSLNFGDSDSLLKLVEMIAHRDGFGDLLADGVRLAAQKIGGDAQKYANHVKGQELPLHEPRGKFGVGLGYALSPTGADHMESPHDPFAQNPNVLGRFSALGIHETVEILDAGPSKVRVFRCGQQIFNLWNILGVCVFAALPNGVLTLDSIVDLIRHATGWNVSLVELLQSSDRMNAMAREFNVREGFTPSDDTWPDKLFSPLPDGPQKGQTYSKAQLEQAKDYYYEMVGWDKETGKPLDGKLIELGLDWLI